MLKYFKIFPRFHSESPYHKKNNNLSAIVAQLFVLFNP